MPQRWEFWIDRGGTFTDVIGAAPDGTLVLRKTPSVDAPAGASGADAASAAVAGAGTDLDPGLRVALEILAAAGASPADIGAVKVGTTVVTNALLEGRGSRVAWVTTRGFGDALRIGQQDRPELFALRVRRPEPLYAEVVEIDERIGADGRVLQAPAPERVREALQSARAAGCDAVAIALLHGGLHDSHERLVAAIARELGFAQVSVSHELTPLPRLVPRGDNTVFDARLGPTLRAYTERLAMQLAAVAPAARLHFMQSSGGLTGADGFRPGASVLSGPAGGLIGLARLGAALGETRLIGFDMGGTSTDVSLHDGGFTHRFEYRLGGARLTVPMLEVHTIAAGGGSILALRDGRCVVGPESAGADPGPACYGRGGPATLTDVQVVLGRLRPATMPPVFGANGRAPIDAAAARAALTRIAARAAGEAAEPDALARLAAGFLDVGVAAMAAAIRHVAIGRGLDPAGFTLFAFGGAAGQHACRVAEASGIGRVIVHGLGSVLSAWGIGAADWIEVRRRGLPRLLDADALAAASATLESLADEARTALDAQHLGAGESVTLATFELRDGQSETTLDVAAGSLSELRLRFAALHLERFGYDADPARLEIEAVRVEVRHRQADAATVLVTGALSDPASTPAARVQAWFNGWCEVPVFDAAALRDPVDGPALLVEPHSTFVLEPGWRIERIVDAQGRPALCARRHGAVPGNVSAAPDAARLEVFNGLFTHVATQMGEVLRRTAQSVNIKERLDFSCALFDGDGRLVANAPHIPVHLGSMGATVRALLESRGGRMRPGDAWMVNSPWHGGTHLPDITVVSPVFAGDPGEVVPRFFVASRAHHADIGGLTPGSMPPFSRHVDEEGILFEDFELVAAGVLREVALREALAGTRWPARNPDRNLADLRAQLAANARGTHELQRALRHWGGVTLARAMQDVQHNAAGAVAAAITALGSRCGRRIAWMDPVSTDEAPCIEVSVELDAARGRARIDFSGTSAAGAHNFNAPRAVTIAAVLYVFRTLVNRPIPLNEGCLAPLEIVIPAGSLLDPPPGSAVVAGNVETSQVIVDALYGALGVLAASQGTMNNLTFGNASLQYYETIAGGAGAGDGFDGCDAVQTHMTNSRLTDPEIIEQRYPVRVLEFAIRRGSGGPGRYRGGDGAQRRLEFLEPLQVAILANRRRTRPFGLHGGGDGQPGVTRLRRIDGRVETLPACAAFVVAAGDIIEVSTPGGGGWERCVAKPTE